MSSVGVSELAPFGWFDKPPCNCWKLTEWSLLSFIGADQLRPCECHLKQTTKMNTSPNLELTSDVESDRWYVTTHLPPAIVNPRGAQPTDCVLRMTMAFRTTEGATHAEQSIRKHLEQNYRSIPKSLPSDLSSPLKHPQLCSRVASCNWEYRPGLRPPYSILPENTPLGSSILTVAVAFPHRDDAATAADTIREFIYATFATGSIPTKRDTETNSVSDRKFSTAQNAIMRFDPQDGSEKPYPSHAEQYREYHGKNTAWLFNPWTGQRRLAGDVGSDILGRLIANE